MNKAPDIYDPGFVKEVFDRCSAAYIAVSYVSSMGFTERWRRQAVENMPEGAAAEPVGYDLMAGTGEVWPHVFRKLPHVKSITAIDISSGMHQRAMARLHRSRERKIYFIEDDVLKTALDAESCDFLISTFGLKTFNPEQHRKLADLVFRVLKPGGVFSFIEASDPRGWPLRPLYMFYLKSFLPLIERLFMRGAQDFAMIGTYCMNFADAEQFAEFLRAAGLEVEFKKYFFGCATGVIGRRPLQR